MTQTTTTTTIDPELLRRMAADIVALPPLLSRYLVNDEMLRHELGLPFEFRIQLGELPPMERTVLYDGVRKACTGQAQTVTASDGQSVDIAFADGAVQLFCDDRRLPQVLPLSYLHPQAKVRLQAWDQLADNPDWMHPLDRDWHALIKAGPLSNEDMCDYLYQAGQSVPATLCAIRRGGPSIPESFEYYRNLGSPIIDYYDEPEFVNDILHPWYRRLLAANLTAALRSLLPLGMFQCTRLRPLLEDLDDDQLWDTLAQTTALQDPGSLLNRLDLALARAGDRRFAALARQSLDALLDDKLPCAAGDAVKLYPDLLAQVYTRLRLQAQLAEQPEYWVRLCALAHTGQLLNLPNGATEPDQTEILHLARHLELISIPGLFRVMPDKLHLPSLIAVQMERLLAGHEGRRKIAKEARTRVQARIEQLRQQGYDAQPNACDPFDLDIAIGAATIPPSEPDPAQVEELFTATRNTGGIDVWRSLYQLSLTQRLPTELLTEVAARAELWPGPSAEVLDELAQLAALAAMNHHGALGEKVIRHCARLARANPDQPALTRLFTIVLLACGYQEKLPDALTRLNRFLRPLAEQLSDPAQIRWLKRTVTDLKRLVSVNFWVFSDTEAILLLAE